MAVFRLPEVVKTTNWDNIYWKMDYFLCVRLKSLRPLLTFRDVFSYLIKICAPVIRYFLSFAAPTFHFKVFSLKRQLHRCPLTVFKCPLSVLEGLTSYREFNYSKMTEKRPGPTKGVRFKEVSVL